MKLAGVAGGWKSKDDATRSILDELKAIISREDKKIRKENAKTPINRQERQPIGMIFSKLHRTISDWSRNDARIKAAFARGISRRKN